MQITHTLQYGTKKAKETITVTLTEADLTVAERSVPSNIWPMLLAIKAERQVLIAKQTQGLVHKKESENTRLAKERGAELDDIYKSLLEFAR